MKKKCACGKPAIVGVGIEEEWMCLDCFDKEMKRINKMIKKGLWGKIV
jgi:hypothetical protein